MNRDKTQQEIKFPYKIIDVQFYGINSGNISRGDLIIELEKWSFHSYEGLHIEEKFSLDLNNFYKIQKSGYSFYVDFFLEGNYSGSFIMNAHDFKTTENLIKKIISVRKKSQIEFREVVNSIYDDLKDNEEVNSMILNFIRTTPNKYLLSTENFLGIEHYISDKKNNVSELTLLSTYEQRSNRDQQLYEETKEFIENYLYILVKVFKKKNCLTLDSYSIFVIWKLIYSSAANYFSTEWEKDYGHFFNNIQKLSLTDCIDIYCEIDIIELKKINNISLLTYYLMHNNKFIDNKNFLNCISMVIDLILERIENLEINNFEKMISSKEMKISYSIDDIDLMGGIEFENFIALLFSKMGYSTTLTKGSGDKGIDVIIEKNGKKMGIQSKCYSNTVSNTAIQEVVAGCVHYGLNKAIVITNNYFTKSAQELAQSNNVILWDRNILKEKISSVFLSED